MPTRTERQIDITISGAYAGQVSRKWLRRTAARVLDQVLPEQACELSLVIADDDTLKRLNREYRGLDEVTDVLSFSSTHSGHWEGEGEPPTTAGDEVPFVLPPQEPRHLGDIIISLPQAARQASPGPSGLEAELAQLVVHGILHLLGFDHLDAQEEASMRTKERELLSCATS